jgi:hypothetical protein
MPQDIEGPLPEGNANLPEDGKNTPYIPVIICAFLCAFFQNTGILSLFFLVPLGYAILQYDGYFPAAAVTAGFCIGMRFIAGEHAVQWTEVLYIAAVVAGFTWIMAGKKLTNIRTAYRFILVSCSGFIVFLFLFFSGGGGENGMIYMLQYYAEALSKILDLPPEAIFDTITSVMLKGGSLLSLFFVFFINRQIAVTAVWIIKRRKIPGGLRSFFVPQNTIWVLSASVAMLLFTRQLKLEIPEILVWNVFAVCGIMFLAQGAGILLNFLDGRSAGFRFIVNVIIVLMVLSPAMIMLVSALILTGITELWIPFRRKKEPASTPEA